MFAFGVFSGGSLKMWREYLGAKALVYGIDIDPSCKVHEDEFTAIYIGNLGDRQFWRMFKAKVPQIDVVIDDGSDLPWEQILTFKELFPVLRGACTSVRTFTATETVLLRSFTASLIV